VTPVVRHNNDGVCRVRPQITRGQTHIQRRRRCRATRAVGRLVSWCMPMARVVFVSLARVALHILRQVSWIFVGYGACRRMLYGVRHGGCCMNDCARHCAAELTGLDILGARRDTAGHLQATLRFQHPRLHTHPPTHPYTHTYTTHTRTHVHTHAHTHTHTTHAHHPHPPYTRAQLCA
jgi:hypothetical protein